MARKTFIFIILSLFAYSAFAEDSVYIPDPNLKAAIEEEVERIRKE